MIPRWSLSTVFILTLALYSSAYVKAQEPIQQTPQAESEQSQDLLVEAIEFCGNNLDSEALRKKLKLKVGQVYKFELLRQDYNNLLSQGCFNENLSEYFFKQGSNGMIIQFKLVDCPTIRNIEYRGLRSISPNELSQQYQKHKILLKPGNPLRDKDLDKALKLIPQLLKDKGFENINIELANNEELNTDDKLSITHPTTVDIIFKIDETPDAYVSEIEFTGNKNFSNAELIAKMEDFNEAKLAAQNSSDEQPNYSISDVESDLAKIGAFYIGQGFPDIKFIDIKPVDTKNRRKVIIEIESGPRYYIDYLSVKGTDILTADEINRVASQMRGKPVTSDITNPLIMAINRRLKAKDIKPYLKVIPNFHKVEPGAESGIADLVVIVEEHPGARFRRIEFKGNVTTRDPILRRAIIINEGDLYNQDMLEISLERLRNLNLFDDVKVEAIEFEKVEAIALDKEHDEVDVLITVTEKPHECE